MARGFLFVLDSVGIGNAPDAAAFGDEGSNTVGHILEASLAGKADGEGRSGPLFCPNLQKAGFFNALHASSGIEAAKSYIADKTTAAWGYAQEVSNGKDTPSGHWEIAGVPVLFDWGYFSKEEPTFPPELLSAVYEKAGLSGSLGNCHASGTEIIAAYGEEHIASGKPIFYTSSDSVFQIAAHESHFGLERLYALCETVRELIDPLNIGRVIARPFIGETAETFQRTGNRRDYSVLPPAPTLLDWTRLAGGHVLAVGKISDIFAHQGVSEVRKASGNEAIMDATLTAMDDARDHDLVFSNFVDFDMLYGHRRNVAGYGAALEAFDRRLPELLEKLQDGDLMVITADHGCDPTWRGTDHTREQVPVLIFGPSIKSGSFGAMTSFADMAATMAEHLSLAERGSGTSILAKISANA